MPLSKVFAKLIPLLTITLLLFNLLTPVSIAFAQDADPPPDPPPAEEVAAAEQPVEEGGGDESDAPAGDDAGEDSGQDEPGSEEPPAEDGEEEAPSSEETDTEEPVDEEPADEAGKGDETGEGEAPTEESEAGEQAPADTTEETTEETEPGEETGDEVSSPEEENPVAEAVQALDEADAVLLDEDGNPLPMASQEAAAALAAPDPQFCPAGLSYNDGGCTSFTTMQDAINEALLQSTSNISGTIFVESGNWDFSGSNDDILLDGFNNGTSLTIQGNANGLGPTTFTTAFLVGTNTSNIFSSLTFNDVTFDEGVVVAGNTGDLRFNDVIANADGGADAISVSNHDGAVSLDHVTANNTFSASEGADIDNTASSSDAAVTVTNSTFNGFVNNGLLVRSDGEINVSNVTANGNGERGLDLNNSLSSSEAGITLNGVTANNNQQGAGLNITSFGSMTLNNVTAEGNLDNGAVLINPGGSEPNLIQITNSHFNNNGSNGTFTGLVINTTGSIVLNGVNANNNTGNGAELFNLGSSNNASVNVFNSNFNGNGQTATAGFGLLISSQGAITLDGVSASNNVGSNGVYGASIANPGGSSAPVTITNSIFNNNVGGTSFGTGLSVFSGGHISLSGVQANLNGSAGGQGTGVNLSGTGGPGVNVSISNSSFDGNFGDGNVTGLDVFTGGTITLNEVTANANTSTGGTAIGARLSNTAGPDNDQQINISNSSFDNNTGGSSGTGLTIASFGNVNLWAVSASGNSTDGVFISILSGPNDISIICSAMQNNGDTGIFVGGDGGDLTIKSTDTSGNGVTPLATSNVANTILGSANCNPDSGGDDDGDKRDGKHEPLDPDDPTPIVLDLYPHSVTFPPMDLLECEGYVKSLFFPSELPGELNAGDTFLRALTMRIEGCEIPEDGLFTIGFDIPATEQGNEFAVLFWDGATGTWVEIPGQMTEDGRYTVTWPSTGTFVLVTR